MNLFNRIQKSVVFRLQHWAKNIGRRNQLLGTEAAKLDLGEIDSLELLLLIKTLRPNIKLIYDVGANRGTWTILAKSIFPDSTVHAFEPLLKLKEIFLVNTKNLKNVILNPIALGAEIGNLEINITSDLDSSSLLLPTEMQNDIFGVKKTDSIPVPISTLDDYTLKTGVIPDIVKLDVQGYELEVLKGAISTLNKIKFIIIEVSFSEFYKGQPLFEEIVSYMFSNGFRVYAFGQGTATGKVISQSDILFINKNLQG